MFQLLERIDRACARSAGRIAHRGGERRMTYAELRARSDAVAAHLDTVLDDDRSPVAVVGHKEPEMLAGFLGAVKAGHPYVPLDTTLPRARIERTIEVAGARATLTPESIRGLAAGDRCRAARRMLAEDPFYVIFTSGSTGDPKGVVITLGCLESFVEWMLGEQRFTERSEVFLNQAPFSFDLSVMDVYLSLATGGTLVSVTADDIANPKRLYRMLATSGTTTWVSTPSFARMCLAEPTFAAAMLPELRRFLFCGETLPSEVAAELLERFPLAAVWNTYGPTEATVATTSVRVDHALLALHSPLPVGYAKKGTRIAILDADGTEVPRGERGEIAIIGPNVSPGYLGRADLTARAFFESGGERGYRTGDHGRLRDGLLFFDGRADEQVKLHGYRIELGDVESNLRALAGVRDAVVVPVSRNGTVDFLAAFVVLNRGDEAMVADAARALRAELAERLPPYMLPRRIEVRDSLPMTVNGKVDRRKLEETLR